MLLEYVPLLQVQRDLYAIPRGGERFRTYLRTMIDPHKRDPNDYANRFATRPLFSRGWLTATVWTGDAPSRARAGEEVATVVHRAAYLLGHGDAAALGGMLAQEGYAMATAGCRQPAPEADELAYTREVLRPLLPRRDRPTVMACLYGDRAAQSLGYPPQGLSDYAGLALALHQARLQ